MTGDPVGLDELATELGEICRKHKFPDTDVDDAVRKILVFAQEYHRDALARRLRPVRRQLDEIYDLFAELKSAEKRQFEEVAASTAAQTDSVLSTERVATIFSKLRSIAAKPAKRQKRGRPHELRRDDLILRLAELFDNEVGTNDRPDNPPLRDTPNDTPLTRFVSDAALAIAPDLGPRGIIRGLRSAARRPHPDEDKVALPEPRLWRVFRIIGRRPHPARPQGAPPLSSGSAWWESGE